MYNDNDQDFNVCEQCMNHELNFYRDENGELVWACYDCYYGG